MIKKSLRAYITAGELVFLILPHGEVLGAAAFQPVKHIVHRIFEGFVILPDFHAVYHFHQRIHVAFFLRPLKDDVGHKGAVQEQAGFRTLKVKRSEFDHGGTRNYDQIRFSRPLVS